MSGDRGHGHAEEPADVPGILAHVGHYVPEQAPLHTFVHHNTLHAFEHLPFDRAVVEATKLFGAEPYQSEAAFAAHLRGGRILAVDLDAVVAEDLGRQPVGDVLAHQRRFDYRSLRLRQLCELPRGPALQGPVHGGRLLDG
ncbi:MAG: putative inorganic carbon transporter subunit DabA, partial [Planctomycetota bacterium]